MALVPVFFSPWTRPSNVMLTQIDVLHTEEAGVALASDVVQHADIGMRGDAIVRASRSKRSFKMPAPAQECRRCPTVVMRNKDFDA